LELVGISTLLAVIISLAVGLASALRRSMDRVPDIGAVAGISLSVFW
jgi:ABC-type dipeptide/oligopeptide/nickel transport system permease component